MDEKIHDELTVDEYSLKEIFYKGLDMKKILVVLIGLVFIFSGCDKKKENNEQRNNLIMGAVIPLTGEVATYGKDLQKGFDLYLEDKLDIKIKYFDTKSNAKDAVNAITKLNSEKIFFALGDATSGNTLAMASVANKNQIILFTPIATSDKLQEAGEFIFRNSPKNEKQANRAYDFLIKERHKNRIGVVYKNSAYSTNLAKVFKDIIKNENKGIEICNVNYNETTDFRIVIEKLKECNVDSVFIPNNYEDTARFLKQLKENNLNVDVVSTDGSYSEKLIEIARGSTDNFYLTMMEVDKKNLFYQEFVKKYKNKYHEEPNIFTAYGYEAIAILSKAIDLSSVKNSTEVRAKLLSTKFDSLTGILTFDKTGELDRSYGIMKVNNDKFIGYKEN